ncbi:unnamed protein product, partial [Rotaria magnacalcarata]
PIQEASPENNINDNTRVLPTLMPADLPTPTISKNDQYQDLSKVLTDPRRIIPIRGASESAMAASNNFLVVFTDNDISMFNVHFCEKKYNKWNDGSIVDICFCSSDIGFVLLTVSNVFIFSARNHNHINVATIQPFEDKTFSNCTSNGKSLLISYRIPGTPIDEIDTSTWKLKKRWKSPNICNCDEYISRLRYSLDFSEIGIIVYLRPRIRFQLCDSNMNTLRSMSVGDTGCCGFTAMPQSSWLLSDGHFLYVIDRNGTLSRIERQNPHGAYYDTGNVAFFPDKTVVIRSPKALSFY